MASHPARPESRYLTKLRLARVTGTAAAGALMLLPTACGGSDGDAFSAAPSTSAAAAVTSTTLAASSTTGRPTTTAASAAFPQGGEMVVDFTFAASSSGQVRNPYIAVWVEDTKGNLVRTISLWSLQSSKGRRYLTDLRGWYSASGGSVDSVTSGATRAAGSYSVVWDGTDATGVPVAQGSYVLYVEAAREHGPYEITSTPITIGDDGFTVTLADKGELADLTATLSV